MTDPDLLTAHLKGDPAAFTTLVARHIHLVHAAATRQCAEHADDITQAVFLLLVQKAPSLRNRPSLAGWLFQATLLCARNARRADRRRQCHEREAAMQPPPIPAEPSAIAHLLPLLDDAIAALPAADREFLILRHLQNQDLADIAARFDLSVPAATKRIQRAVNKLRAWFLSQNQTVPDSSLSALFLTAAAHRAPATLHITTATVSATAATLAKGALLTMATTKLQTAVLLAAASLLIPLLVAGAYFHFHHADAAPSPTPVLTPVAAPSTEITLTGTVKDAAGNPIDHAFVSQGWSPFAGDKSFHYTYTDTDGSFALTRIKPGDTLLLTATAPGFSPQVIQSGKLLTDPAPAAFALAPGHTLKLHFIDQRGNVIKNVLAEPISWQAKDVLRGEYVTKHNSRAAMETFISDDNGDITWNSAPTDPVQFVYSQFVKDSPYCRGVGSFTASDKTTTITLKDALKINATVVDAKTHQPIPVFDFFIGEGDFNPAAPESWIFGTNHGENGAFSYLDHEFFRFVFIRVEAPGYPPAVQSFLRDKPPASLTFNLSAAAALHLTVLTPDKQPADNVRVYTATAPTYFNFGNDTVQEGVSPSDPPFQTTDADGHCLLTDPGKTPARILVLAPDGYAERLLADLRSIPTITLEPWASLNLHIHDASSTPLAHTLVEITYTIPKSPDAPSVTIYLRAKTSATGDVSFLRLPPRQLTIANELIANENTPFAQYVSNILKTLTPTPGQSLDVSLPDNGHSLAGKLVNPDGSPLPTPSRFSIAYILPPRFPDLLTPEEKKHADQLSPEDHKKWWPAFQKENAQRIADYVKKQNDFYATHHSADSFLIQPDGSFHTSNIPPGDYTLTVSLLDLTGKDTLTLFHPFTMPATPTTLNLGNLPLEKFTPPQQ